MLPRQYVPRTGSRVAGTTLVREPGTRAGASGAASGRFLASGAGSRLTGQTLRLD